MSLELERGTREEDEEGEIIKSSMERERAEGVRKGRLESKFVGYVRERGKSRALIEKEGGG